MVDQNSADNVHGSKVTEQEVHKEPDRGKQLERSKIAEQNLAYADGSYGNYHGHNRLHYETLSETSSLGSRNQLNAQNNVDLEPEAEPESEESEDDVWMMARRPREFNHAVSVCGSCWILLVVVFGFLLAYNRQVALENGLPV